MSRLGENKDRAASTDGWRRRFVPNATAIHPKNTPPPPPQWGTAVGETEVLSLENAELTYVLLL